jgi:hypothetical protein
MIYELQKIKKGRWIDSMTFFPFNTSAYSATNAKGLMMGSLHKIDNFGNFWFPSTVYYDDKNRSIQSISYQDSPPCVVLPCR